MTTSPTPPHSNPSRNSSPQPRPVPIITTQPDSIESESSLRDRDEDWGRLASAIADPARDEAERHRASVIVMTRLTAVARRLRVNDAFTRDDLVSDAFTQVLRGRFRHGSLDAWAMTVMRRKLARDAQDRVGKRRRSNATAADAISSLCSGADPVAQCPKIGLAPPDQGISFFRSGSWFDVLAIRELLDPADLDRLNLWAVRPWHRIVALCLSLLYLSVPDALWERWLREANRHPPFPALAFPDFEPEDRVQWLATAFGYPPDTIRKTYRRDRRFLKGLRRVRELRSLAS